MISYRRICFFITCGLTCLFIYFAFHLSIDNRPDGLIDTQSKACVAYCTYLQRFSSEHIILVGVRLSQTAKHPKVLERLIEADAAMRRMPQVQSTTSLMDISTARKTGDGISRWRLVSATDGKNPLPQLDNQLLVLLRNTYPAVKQLISDDLKTMGIVVELRSTDPGQNNSAIMEAIRNSIRDAFGPEAVSVHISGGPVLMEAIRRHNVENAFIFLICACIAGIAIEIYIFKNILVSIFIYGVSAVAAVWSMGIMALANLSLNPISGMAFGMVLILTTMTVIHVVTHFYERCQDVCDNETALRKAVASVGRPGFMCTVTTAIGFLSIAVSSVPTVRQFGLIMSLGALLSFGLVYLLLPYLLLNVKWATPRRVAMRPDDVLVKVHNTIGRSVFKHRSWYVVAAILLLAVLTAGIPQIRQDTSIMHLFHPNAPVVLDYEYIQTSLAPHQGLHVMIETPPGKNLNAQSLRTIKDFEDSLTALDDIQSSHSLFRVLETIYAVCSEMRMLAPFIDPLFYFSNSMAVSFPTPRTAVFLKVCWIRKPGRFASLLKSQSQ